VAYADNYHLAIEHLQKLLEVVHSEQVKSYWLLYALSAMNRIFRRHDTNSTHFCYLSQQRFTSATEISQKPSGQCHSL
jgi:hypothetical protein